MEIVTSDNCSRHWNTTMTRNTKSLPISYSTLSHPTEIRLVILEPGSGNDPIYCHLLHILLDVTDGETMIRMSEVRDRKYTIPSGIPYDALSYEWGEPISIDPNVTVDGIQIRVRQNLRDALWHIRKPAEDRHLWVDAISINQLDIDERSKQVRLMGYIYRKASTVIAWLGKANEDSDLALDTLRRFNIRENFEDFVPGMPDFIPEFVSALEMHSIWKLVTRTYWRRLWIIQETQTASQLTLCCGTRSVDARNMKKYGQWIWNRHMWSPTDDGESRLFKTPGWSLLDARGSNPKSIYTWLVWCDSWKSMCKEPRDVIYALLGVAGDCQNGEISSDYSKPLAELYAEVFRIFEGKDSRFGTSNEIPLSSPGAVVSWRILNDLGLKYGLIDLSMHEKIERKISERDAGTVVAMLFHIGSE